MPTEFLHGLYDGGIGAGLRDYWDVMGKSKTVAGGFLWVWSDEGVVRTDQDGRIDNAGNQAPDGMTGPHREKEGSYFTVKEIWSPIQLAPPGRCRGRAAGVVGRDHRHRERLRLHDAGARARRLAVVALCGAVVHRRGARGRGAGNRAGAPARPTDVGDADAAPAKGVAARRGRAAGHVSRPGRRIAVDVVGEGRRRKPVTGVAQTSRFASGRQSWSVRGRQSWSFAPRSERRGRRADGERRRGRAAVRQANRPPDIVAPRRPPVAAWPRPRGPRLRAPRPPARGDCRHA